MMIPSRFQNNIIIMRKMNFFFLLAITFVSVCCSNDDEKAETKDSVTCSPSQLNVDYGEVFETIEVSANREWMAYSNEDWISCNPTGSINATGSIKVTIEANPTTTSREGAVIVKAGSKRFSVEVKQEGKPIPEIEAPEGYKLVWNDEFDQGDHPSSEWYYETGGSGWGNNELQHYVSGDKDGEQLAVVKNGILSITAKKIDGTVYSIRMNTNKSWTYGYFEARLRVPGGKGVWPAFWMLPKDFNTWPDDGEIDIMEYVGYDPNVVHSTVHTKAYNHMNGTQKGSSKRIENAETEFHVYAVEWTADYIKGFVDGEEYFHFENDKTGNKDTWPFFAPFYLKLNLAWGGNWGGAQGVDESALPATYEIDYVRVFQKNEE